MAGQLLLWGLYPNSFGAVRCRRPAKMERGTVAAPSLIDRISSCPAKSYHAKRLPRSGCVQIVLMSDRCLMKNRSLLKQGRRGFSPLHPNSIDFHGQLPAISLFHDLEQMGVGQQPFDLLRAGTLGGNQDLLGRVTVVNDYAGSLPRFNGGSASALCVSRPARRLLALWPVWSLSRPRRPFVIGVLQTMLLPPPSAPTATGWSDICRAGFAPAEEWRLLTAHRRITLRVAFGVER